MTLQELRTRLATLKTAARRHDHLNNEGGEGYNPHRDEIARLENQIDALAEVEFAEKIAAQKVAEDALWTLELTEQRRAEWNTWVRSTSAKGPLLTTHVTKRIQETGWGPSELKRAIARHSL